MLLQSDTVYIVCLLSDRSTPIPHVFITFLFPHIVDLKITCSHPVSSFVFFHFKFGLRYYFWLAHVLIHAVISVKDGILTVV